MEFRSPDPLCNPYFSFASIIHAGLEGIKHKEIPSASVEKNLYHATQEELDDLGIVTIPCSLQESLNLFKASTFTRHILGNSLHARLIELKEIEWREYSHKEENNPFTVTDWEKRHHRLVS